jgi:sodium/proline symporter
MSSSTISAFFAYFFVLLLIGLCSYKKQKSSADFIVGSRSLNFWVIALSAHASDMSSWLFMAFPAMLYLRGMPQMWAGIGLLLGMFLNWQFIAIKLRKSTELHDSYTLPSFFEKRFSDTSGIIRTTTAITSVLFLTSYLSAGLMSMGLLLESIFGIDYYLGLGVATAVVVAYTFVGGFTTVAWTDLFQALFLLAVVIIVPTFAFLELPNGFQTIYTDTLARNIDLSIISSYSTESLLTIVFLVFGWGLGYFGQPHIVTKFMGIRNTEELTKSKYVGMSWMVVTLSAAAFIGLVGISYFPEPLEKPELVFVEMVKNLFHPFIAGIFLCGVISATMSTMDSQILVAASVLSEDFYMQFKKKKISVKQHLAITRASVLVVSLASLFISFNKSSTILDAVYYAWAGLGCSFGPLMLLSLYFKKANKYGAIAGILIGGAIAGTWDLINPYVSSYPIPAMIPGFTLSALAIFTVSMLTQQDQQQQEQIRA